MKLTSEQQAIIASAGNIKINAVAGSGKTTTIIEYAASRPANSRILYLAFNKTVKMEAVGKFRSKGLHNVTVETAHSLAFRHVVRSGGYTVRTQGYKAYEIAELLGIEGNGEKHAEYIVASHINKFIAYFCNSDKETLKELNYLDLVPDKKAKAFVKTVYSYIESKTRLLLGKMDKGEIEITHDFYLKKFQLLKPDLKYDYILFDEGQDASPAMLDIFFRQKCVKVIVGDTHQQIYGWRFAVNSLEKANYQTFHLSVSFRFGQDIANLATGILDWKNHLDKLEPVSITGKGLSAGTKEKAVIARTNLGLLLKAIEYVTETDNPRRVYFEGNIHSYTYADEGASLYDVLNLHLGKRRLIRDRVIREMTDLKDLREYVEKTQDMQLGMMIEIVKTYGSEIPNILKMIKDLHVENEEKHLAEMIFSTVHRCKGMEYDHVILADDFITEEKLESAKLLFHLEPASKPRINEEINLLYVAITRTKNSIRLSDKLMPEAFPESEHITVIRTIIAEDENEINSPVVREKLAEHSEIAAPKEKAYSVEHLRITYHGAYMPWNSELDEELAFMYKGGIRVKDLADYFGRTKGAIYSRIKKLEIEKTTITQ